MTLENRMKLIKENRACFSCLKKTSKNHKAANCSRRRQCTVTVNGQQCKSFHHPMLHECGPSNQVGVASVNNNKEVLLPVIQVEILGQEARRRKGNVLLDSGAQVSLIRNAVAKELKLKGKDARLGEKKRKSTQSCIKFLYYRLITTVFIISPLLGYHQLVIVSRQ